jgi:DNA repair exonuclease SbcCD ATPase subunit
MKVLEKVKNKKFTHVIHVADIHIRLNKRHEEYREVFSEFYDAVLNSPPDSLVAILGDLFHSKSDLSPECVQMASDFCHTLADLRTTILIAGNHDATLSNKSRLDSLTPIVDALNHPNLFYLRDTGLYGCGNILFNNMGVFDPPEKYILGKDIPPIYKNQYDHIIALFHGAVDRAALDTGFSISNPAIMPPLFDENDIALLGDIHKKQDMQDYSPSEGKPCIHYPGSMIQQNHGESLNCHGYSMWDLKSRSYDFHELTNDYGFFTIEIHEGKLTTPLIHFPKKAVLRVKCFDTVASEVKAVVANIKVHNDIAEVSYLRMDKDIEKKDAAIVCKNIILNDLNSEDYQGKLIAEYLEKKYDIVDPIRIGDILKINRDSNALIKQDEFARNLKWKLIRFEYDNMFTYGEGNVVDFTKASGVYGIFGPNKSGKSSLLSAITFCLFDKFDRGFKGIHVRNIEKTNFRCQIEIDINGVRYFIERTGSTTRTGNVKVNVKFWRVINGEEEELHGTARRNTNDIIRDYIGTYEDFVLTTLSVQSAKNNISFIDMGNTERKDLLVQFIGLNVFDRLNEAASERNKELNALLKIHKNKNYAFEKNEISNSLRQASSIFTEEEDIVKKLRKQIADVNEEIIKETSALIRLEVNVSSNFEELTDRKIKSETNVRQKKEAIEAFKITTAKYEKELLTIGAELTKIDESNLVENHKTYNTLTTKITNLRQEMELKKVEIRGRMAKVERLKDHKYDPNCKFCTNNSFVQDAELAKVELVNDKKETDKMVSALKNLTEEFTQYEWVEKAYQKYTSLLTEQSKIKDDSSVATQKLIIAKNDLEKLNAVLKSATQDVDLYNRNEVSISHNVKIQSHIGSYRNTLTNLEIEFQRHNRTLMDVNGKITMYKNKIEELTDTLKEIQELEYEAENYKNYMNAVGRDGIPYEVICHTVPEIENEVNSILSQVVEYTVEFETDGKNVVPYIVYDQRKWPIEMSSGFERFVASLAIRVALTNISNLPKTTCLMIDEGFGTLDSDNLASMYTLFSFLKSNFDFIFVVSHIDALKDAVDETIEITSEGNFSKVIFE